MNQRPDPKIIPETHEHRKPLVQRSQRSESAFIERDSRQYPVVSPFFDFVALFDERKNFIQPPLQGCCAFAFDFVGVLPAFCDLGKTRARGRDRWEPVHTQRHARIDVRQQAR